MEPTRLCDLIHYQAAQFPLERAFGHRVDGQWKYYSTQEIVNLGNKVSRGLLKLGVKKGDRIGVAVTQNRTVWTILDVGIQQIGPINVPV